MEVTIKIDRHDLTIGSKWVATYPTGKNKFVSLECTFEKMEGSYCYFNFPEFGFLRNVLQRFHINDCRRYIRSMGE